MLYKDGLQEGQALQQELRRGALGHADLHVNQPGG